MLKASLLRVVLALCIITLAMWPHLFLWSSVINDISVLNVNIPNSVSSPDVDVSVDGVSINSSKASVVFSI